MKKIKKQLNTIQKTEKINKDIYYLIELEKEKQKEQLNNKIKHFNQLSEIKDQNIKLRVEFNKYE